MNKSFLFPIFIAFFFTTFADGKEIIQGPERTVSNEIVYRSATERYVDDCGRDSIEIGLKRHGGLVIDQRFLEKISHLEKAGFVGYHGTTQKYRIFQDIVKLIIEDVVGIPVREDFYFFRLPGDPHYSYMNLREGGSQEVDASRFLSMNFAIYSNHNIMGSSSYHYFTLHWSAAPKDYEVIIKPLFVQLGIPTDKIHELFKIGEKHLSKTNGVLYQIFDMSHLDPSKTYYSLADAHCISYGSKLPFSSVVKGTFPTRFPNHIRMLLTNEATLNPYSPLVIKRFDKLSSEATVAYMEELRLAVKSLSYSQDKAISYRDELFLLWK